MFFYTYYSYDPYGRGYIGSRSSSVEPSLDPYMGSFTDKTFNPTEKIILSVHKTRKNAILAEIKLHKFYDVGINDHFANKVNATKVGLCSYGMIRINNGKEEKLVRKGQIPKGWIKGRLVNPNTYISGTIDNQYDYTCEKYQNDSRRGSMFDIFKDDVKKSPDLLEISIRELAKLYNTSHTSICRWKKFISRSFAISE